MTDHPMTEQYTLSNTSFCAPREKARLYPFGWTHWYIIFTEHDEIPNRWVRFWTKFFFNSKWELPDD